MSDLAIADIFFFQAEDGIRDHCVTGVQTCALPILPAALRDNYFTVSSEVYFFVPSAKFNDSLIRDVVRTTTTQLFTGALTRLEGSEIIARQPASTSLIEELADNSELILIGAYDGEAVLIWSPQPVSITE